MTKTDIIPQPISDFRKILWQKRISCLSRFPIFEKFCQTNWCSKIIRFDEIAKFSSNIFFFLVKLLWFWLSLLFGIFDIFISIWKGTFWWIDIFNQTFSCLKISRNSSGLAWVVPSRKPFDIAVVRFGTSWMWKFGLNSKTFSAITQVLWFVSYEICKLWIQVLFEYWISEFILFENG